MSHSLITGTTESGKTSCAKVLGFNYKRLGIRRIILDPLNDPKWDCGPTDLQTTNPDEFMQVAKANKQCALFVDESAKAIGKYDTEKEWITTMSRHWGHKAHLICQRPTQLNLTSRSQCSIAWIFWIGPDDAKTLSQEFKGLDPDMISNLGKLEFIKATRFDGAAKYRIAFDASGRPYIAACAKSK